MSRASATRLAGAGLAALLLAGPAAATPAQIVILRHGEKADSWKLCPPGEERAKALAATYLGREATTPVFAGPPAAIVAITLHTLELAAPSAATWPMPIRLYAAVPEAGQTKADFTIALNARTQEAVRDVLADPAYDGKTVVMVWEHDHIADARLEAAYPGEKVTLRQLLGLDALPGVPDTWPGQTYDYFWIVDFDPGATAATGFRMAKQAYAGPFAAVPANDWGTPDGLTAASGCER